MESYMDTMDDVGCKFRNFFGPPYLRWPMGLMKIATTMETKNS